MQEGCKGYTNGTSDRRAYASEQGNLGNEDMIT